MRAFETLLFDLDSNTIQLYIDEVNITHKLRIKDEKRFDAFLYFED